MNMIKQDTSTELGRRRDRSRVVGLVLLALLAVATLGFAGCGGGDDEAEKSRTTAEVRGCQVGEPPVLMHRRLPPWVEKEGLGSPPLTLGCFGAPFHGASAFVGFANVGPSVCVTVDGMRQKESHGEVCTGTDETILERCEGSIGCIKGYIYQPEANLTEFSGPLDARVKNIEITVDGKPVSADVGIAHISGSIERRISASEPFGFFAVYLRGCVEPKTVKVNLLAANMSHLGMAKRWDFPVGCPKGNE